MKLVSPNQSHLAEISGWVTNQADLIKWAGPGFRYPFTIETFTEDLNLERLASYCLIDEREQLLAFGQCYQRIGRCHLGRLIVNPTLRGQGIAKQLINKLMDSGFNAFNTVEASLFVLADNESAIKAYTKLGFLLSEYPEPIPIDNCLYMIKQ